MCVLRGPPSLWFHTSFDVQNSIMAPITLYISPACLSLTPLPHSPTLANYPYPLSCPVQVGTPVEVRQPDGQFLSATIMKLTDQSTYTVGKSMSFLWTTVDIEQYRHEVLFTCIIWRQPLNGLVGMYILFISVVSLGQGVHPSA